MVVHILRRFFFPKLVWRRTEMSVLVIMLLHANNIIFVGFWPNHFAGNGVLSVYTTTDRIFQDVAFFLLVVVPLTNPHPLTLYYPKMLVSSWSVLSCAQRQERPINPVTQCSHRNFRPDFCHDLKITKATKILILSCATIKMFLDFSVLEEVWGHSITILEDEGGVRLKPITNASY